MRASSRRSTSAAFRPEMGKSRAFNSAFRSTTRKLGTSSAVTMVSISRCLWATVCRLKTDPADQHVKAAMLGRTANSTDAHTPAKPSAREHVQFNSLVDGREQLCVKPVKVLGHLQLCSFARCCFHCCQASTRFAVHRNLPSRMLPIHAYTTHQQCPTACSPACEARPRAGNDKTQVKGLQCHRAYVQLRV